MSFESFYFSLVGWHFGRVYLIFWFGGFNFGVRAFFNPSSVDSLDPVDHFD